IGHAAEGVGIPTASLWASVPHYVAGHTPSPKATLALLDRLETITGMDVPRGELSAEAAAWEASIDAAAADDEEMSDYIRQLEQTRDTWDSPEASGDAIAQEFERYLRRGGEGPAKPGRDDPPRR
ncbi:MAG: PAC2 family protein, partial [Actinobacteria bacterium]|nr:PAC2 family protein [Actinomycetota bacterium]